MRRATLIFALIFATSITNATVFAADFFSSDQSLLAMVRCASFARVNNQMVKILKEINPHYRGTRPLLDQFASLIFNEQLTNVESEQWGEAALFALPAEPISWVYTFSVNDERRYLADMLALGNVRQETQERGVTRYRLTGSGRNAAFYLTFSRATGGKTTLAIIGETQHAVERARSLYAPLTTNGLLADAGGDFAFAIHHTRLQLNFPRALPNFLEILRQDLAADLAGVTAKADNPLVVFLAALTESWTRFARNFAIVSGQISLANSQIGVKTQIALQYGGSVHYALSAIPQKLSPPPPLPDNAEITARAELWGELCEQLWEGLGGALKQLFPPEKMETLSPEISQWHDLLTAVEWQASAVGIVAGEGRTGPAVVACLRFDDAKKLADLWKETEKLLLYSAAAETLSESGIKWEISVDQEPEVVDDYEIYRAAIGVRAMNFALPDTLAGTHRYLAARADKFLVIVSPTAVLDFNQYRDAEKHLLTVMTAALEKISREQESSEDEDAPQNDGVFFTVSGNFLRAAQLALSAESAWPQAGEPDRLPIPWATFNDEIKMLSPIAPPATFQLRSARNQIFAEWQIPVKTIAELAAAFLDLRPTAKP